MAGRGTKRSVRENDKAVDALMAVGLTASEARVYLALLAHSPATGYELAADSGVPRSAIYTVLRRIEEAGLAQKVHPKPARYVPMAPRELPGMLGARYQQELVRLESVLREVTASGPERVTWTVTGYDAIMAEAARLVEGAKHAVHASLWRREALTLAGSFETALRNDASLVLFSFTDLSGLEPRLSRRGKEGGGSQAQGRLTMLQYGLDEAELERHWRHKLILVADHVRVLVGGADEDTAVRAVRTDEPALVEMAVSNLVLDVTLFGERKELDTSAVIEELTTALAPIDEMLTGVGRSERR